MIIKRDKVAIVYKGKEYSYTDVLQYSLLYSRYFESVQGKIEKVMIFSENNPEYAFAIYATLRLNAVVVPIDVTSTSKELIYVLKDCRPDIVFTTSDKKDFVQSCIDEIDDYEPKVILSSDIDDRERESLELIEIPLGDMDQVVSIIYTSGTTGSPKGVMLTYGNYWYNVVAVTEHVKIFTDNSRVLLILPLHHVFPFAGALLAPIYAGGTVYMVESLAPDVILRTLQEGKITLIIGVPRLYDALAKGVMSKINASVAAKLMFKFAKLVSNRAFSKLVFKAVHDKFGGSMEYFVSGGAALSTETGNIYKTLGFSVLEGFGMTECAPMIAFTRPSDIKVGYCGQLLPKLELKFGENNEIMVKGPNVMKGYYNRPEETAEIIQDGWLHTGDTGEMDDKGRLKITGRIKEIIVTPNGKNINPVEIEHALLANTKVIKDVAVFLYDDILQAIVIPEMNVVRASTGKTIEECVKREIESYNEHSMAYKRIMKFHITSQEFPKTKLGKIQRFKLASFITNVEKNEVKEDLSGKSEIYRKLKKFLDSETEKNAGGNDHFEIDLALDSLGRITFLAYIEDNFNVSIKEEDMNSLSTLNKLSEYVESHASEGEKIDNLSWKTILETSEVPVNMPKSGFIHWFMAHFIKIFFHIFYIFRCKGDKNIPDGPCIFVANHRSGFDPVFITSTYAWSKIKDTFFFAKDKHFQSAFTKFMAKRNNIILMDINSNLRLSLQSMYQVLKQGKKIMIFPEGTRSKDAILKDFKDSFAILGSELKVPIVPVAIVGSESATYKKVRIPRFMSRIEVRYLDIIEPQDGESYKELNTRVRNAIVEGLRTQ